MSSVRVFVGTEKGAFVLASDEGRRDWKVEGPLLKGWNVTSIAVDSRAEPATTWAAANHFVYGPSLQRSEDGGATWRLVEKGPALGADSESKLNAIWSIAPGRASEPGVLYAGVADAALFRSDDGGESWSEVAGLSGHPSRPDWSPGAGGLCCHTILIDPGNEDRMWVGISAVGVFRTDDGGTSWQTRNAGMTKTTEEEEHKDVGYCVHRLVLDPRDSNRLFQQNHRGVYRSSDGADSWERIENGLPLNATGTCFGFPMAMHPHDGDTLFVVPQESDEYRFAPEGRLAVYRTTDAGASWQPMTRGLPDSAYVGVLRQAMATDTLDEPGVYFGTSAGDVFCSIDGGESWRALSCRLPRISSVLAVTEA